MVKILCIGDVSGRPGRETLKEILPGIKQKHSPDLVVANIENAAGGKGITGEVIAEAISAGVDICTGGDHTFSISSFWEDLQGDLPFVRPANYEAKNLPGKGFDIVDLGSKGQIAIVNMLGQDLFGFNQRVRNPFWFIDELLEDQKLKEADLILIDFHAEASSEKLCFAWYVKDRVGAVVGTHTHVPTADNRILGSKIAYVTDIGQVGPYQASLWASFDSAIHNFKYPKKQPFNVEEEGPRVFNSVLLSFQRGSDNKKYSPVAIERIDVVVE